MRESAWDEIDGEAVTAPVWYRWDGSRRTSGEEWGGLHKLLPLIDPATWHGIETPDRRWLLRDWIPDRQATYITGPGSAGKSLLAQLLCTCVALGLPFLGVEVREGPAIYLSCEDDADELHRRQKAICAGLGVPLTALSGKLHLVSLAGEMNAELCAIEADGTMRATDRYDAIAKVTKAAGVRFIALDNVAHVFSGNENIRHDVAAFVSLLNRLAIRIDGAVLLIGHPNKAGDSFSGSTAWENQVRSRLYLEIPGADVGDVRDRDVRQLSRQKSNYAVNGETLSFRWHQWTFVREEDLPGNLRAELAVTAQGAAENAAFLRCLARATQDRRAVSHVNGSNYAPRVFAKMIEGKGVTQRGFEQAMERLLHKGDIKLDQDLWKGSDRHVKRGIAAAEKRGDPPAGTPCGDLREPPSQGIENTAATLRAATPLYTTYKPGAATEAATPAKQEKADGPIDFTAYEQTRQRGAMILAPGESGDEPIPGWGE